MIVETRRLGELAKVISGFAFKSKEFIENGIPVIKIKNIRREYVDLSESHFLPESYLSVDQKFYVSKGDILISLTGSHITLPNSVVGRVAQYKQDSISLLNQRAGKITVVDEEALDNQYLYYFLCQNSIRAEIALFGHGGANQCNVSPSNVESIEILVPPLPTQRRIASILSAYDDLIENNLQRIKLLEEAAQHIYREWFVHFRFPGWEEVEFGEDGLPEGWRRTGIGQISVLKGGYAFKSKDWEEKGIPVIRIKNIRGNTVTLDDCAYVNDSTVDGLSRFTLFSGDLLIAMTGATVGKVGLVPEIDEKIYLNQRVGVFRSKFEDSTAFLLSFFLSDEAQKQVSNLAYGAAQPNISGSQIENIQTNIGDEKTMMMFRELVDPMFKLIIKLHAENRFLKQARDILLPRLMNQTIQV